MDVTETATETAATTSAEKSEDLIKAEAALPVGFRIVVGYTTAGEPVTFSAYDQLGWFGGPRLYPAEALADARTKFDLCPQVYYARELMFVVSNIEHIEKGRSFTVCSQDALGDPVNQRLLLFREEDSVWLRDVISTKFRDEKLRWIKELRCLVLSDADLGDAFKRAYQEQPSIKGITDPDFQEGVEEVLQTWVPDLCALVNNIGVKTH